MYVLTDSYISFYLDPKHLELYGRVAELRLKCLYISKVDRLPVEL